MKFLASVVAEMRKVTWPTFSENVRDTSILLMTGLFFAICLVARTGSLNKGLLGCLSKLIAI